MRNCGTERVWVCGARRDAGRALVQDRELGPVVHQARHAQPLLLAQAQLAAPVDRRAQAAGPLRQVLQVHQRQQPPQLGLRDHVSACRARQTGDAG